jgi:MarR family transcriptional regulator, lower aerobic nicotinate degradation pathway regulator
MRVTKVKSSKATRAKAPPAPPPKAKRAVPLVAERPAVKKGKSAAAPAPAAAALPPGAFNIALRRAHTRMLTIFAEAMQRYDLTPVQYEALSKLEAMGPMSQSQLERQMMMEPAELLTLVGRLNRQGFVRPAPSPQDPRFILLDLAPEARAIMGEIRAAADKAAVKTLSPLDASEAKTLTAILAKIA